MWCVGVCEHGGVIRDSDVLEYHARWEDGWRALLEVANEYADDCMRGKKSQYVTAYDVRQELRRRVVLTGSDQYFKVYGDPWYVVFFLEWRSDAKHTV